jgi:hypothetical protein
MTHDQARAAMLRNWADILVSMRARGALGCDRSIDMLRRMADRLDSTNDDRRGEET